MSSVTVSPSATLATNSIASGSASAAACEQRRTAKTPPPPVRRTKAPMRKWTKGNLMVTSASDMEVAGWAGTGREAGGGGGRRESEDSRALVCTAENQLRALSVRTPRNLDLQSKGWTLYTVRLEADPRSIKVNQVKSGIVAFFEHVNCSYLKPDRHQGHCLQRFSKIREIPSGWATDHRDAQKPTVRRLSGNEDDVSF